MQGRNYYLLILSILFILVSSTVAWGDTRGAFIPLNFDLIEQENEFSILRFNFPSFSADFEAIVKEEPYVPIRALASYCGYEVASEAEKWVVTLGQKVNYIYLKNSLIEMKGVGVVVKGLWYPFREEYFLSLSDFQILIGVSAIWNPSLMEINFGNIPKFHDQTDHELEEGSSSHPHLFQPVNRLSYTSTTSYSFYTPPDSEEFTTALSWRTGGTVFDGQLTIGGTTGYHFGEGDFSCKLNHYLWEKETVLGKWSLGTLTLPYSAFYPYNWQVKGLAYATPDWRPHYFADKPRIRGQAPVGSIVELWVDDLLYQSKQVDNGEYEFELWLVPRRSHRLHLLIKAEERVVEEEEWIFLPRDNYQEPNTTHFITALGLQEETRLNSGEDLYVSVSEWLLGFKTVTLGLNLAAIEETDTTDRIVQFSEVFNWQVLSNLTLETRAWYVTPDLGKAGKVSLNFGLPKTTFLTSYYYQPETFSSVFAQPEIGELSELELGAYYQPKRDLLFQYRGAFRDREEQDSTYETIDSHEAGLTIPLLSGNAMGILGRTDQTSADDLETVNKVAELTWSTSGLSQQLLELGWRREEETAEVLPDFEGKILTEETTYEKYWLELGFGFSDRRRYSLDLFTESTRYEESKDKARAREDGLNLTLWQKNLDASYFSFGVGFSELQRDTYSWQKWSLNTSYYKEIIPETYLRIAGNYSYEADSPAGDAKTCQISVEIDGGFAFTPYGILPGENSGSLSDGVISGQVFMDLNGNGIMDKEEEGVPGIEVGVDDIALAITDGQGRFIFNRITPGIRRISINIYTLPIKYRAVHNEQLLTVTAGSTQSINLGIEIVGSASGRVYLDNNKNGLYDQGDQALRGVKVTTADGKYSTITGQSGDYYLLLTPGTYRLQPDESSLPDGVPGKENIVTITTAAEELHDIDFSLQE